MFDVILVSLNSNERPKFKVTNVFKRMVVLVKM